MELWHWLSAAGLWWALIRWRAARRAAREVGHDQVLVVDGEPVLREVGGRGQGWR